jgi:hypothetical protein
MSQPFSTTRPKHSASFGRLTGVSVATFDTIFGRLRRPSDKAHAGKRKSGRLWETAGFEDHFLSSTFRNSRCQAQSLHESSEQWEGDFHVLDT